MAKAGSLSKMVAESTEILQVLGVLTPGMTRRRIGRMAKAFLAVAGMTANSKWTQARSDNRLRSRDVIKWMNEHLGEAISSGSYDDIRRKDLKLPVEAGLIRKSAGKEAAATNDGTRTYALSTETADLLHFFGTEHWLAKLMEYRNARVSLTEQLSASRLQHRIPIHLGEHRLLFGPGEHNLLQKAIVEEFLPLFGQGAQVLYLGDTENKFQWIERQILLDLGFFALAHEELPDVVAYSKIKNWLFIIEAVHSANPIGDLRKRKLEELTRSCKAAVVYVTAFLTRDAFRRFSGQIAWETEVWIADAPDHLIHFNGDKFLGPHTNPVQT